MKFQVVVVQKSDHTKREVFRLEAETWASCCMKAHNMIQDRMQREDFQTNYELKALIMT